MLSNRPAPPAIFLILSGMMVLLVVSTACGRKSPTTLAGNSADVRQAAAEPTRAAPAETDSAPSSPIPAATEVEEQADLTTVYFDFDHADLGESARATLRSNAERLKSRPAYEVVIEGHCDERGTVEYNLALGQRRAHAVRAYLTALGVPTSQMSIVSYGEQSPVDPGHDDDAWAKNRRVDFRSDD